MLDTPLVAGAISAFPVPPKDQLITITFGQLQSIISAAVAEATKPFLERLSILESNQTTLQREILGLRASCEAEITRVCEDIAFDRRRLCQLEESRTQPTTPPGDKTTARIEKLKEFLKARGGGATFQEVERLLNIRPNQMTKLVSQLDKRSFEIFARSGDRRQRVIRLKARIIQ